MGAFPVDTKIDQDAKGDFTLYLSTAGEVDYIIKIVELTEDQFDQACSFVAAHLQKREPLLQCLQRSLKKELDVLELTSLLREQYRPHLSSCMIAYASRNAGSDPPILAGVCFNRVVPFNEEPSSLAALISSNPAFRFVFEHIPTTVANTFLVNALSSIGDSNQNSTDGIIDNLKSPTEPCEELTTVFEIGPVVVDWTFCTRRIATGFATRAVEIARKQQCILVRCDTTNVFLAKALHQVGFKTVMDLAYPDINYRLQTEAPDLVETSYPHECLHVLGLLNKLDTNH